MIDNVVAALGLGLNLTDEEIADVLWLAVQMQQFGDGIISEQGDRNEALENAVSNQENPKQSAQPLRNDDRDRQDENKKDERNFEVHSKNAQGDDRSTRRSDELQLKIPDARSLQKPLELARSLRPLMRRVPSHLNTLLDEEATVRRIAEEKIWCPVLRPALEPWLDLALVIDDSASMLMWRHTIAELQHFLSSYGVFRDVRVWRLGTDKAQNICVRAGVTASDRNSSPRSPSELIESNGRGLVLVVSDCIAPIWRNGAISTALQIWSRSGMVAILQMLPDWLWARTALGRGVAAQFSALAAGIPNYQLTTTTVSTWYDIDLATSIKIPVVTLEPEKFTAWAEMLAGKGGAWSAGIVFEPELFSGQEVAIEFDGASELDAEDRVQSFRLTASPIARRLAGLLAAAPVISLPIVRILQSKVLTQSQPVHVAEVFLGGLLKPLSEITAKTNPNYVQYDFIEGVRDLLLESVPSSEIVNVVAVVSEYIAERLGISLEEFGAVIRNPRQVENTELVSQTRPFALLTAKILKRLGGEYAHFADSIVNNISIEVENTHKKELSAEERVQNAMYGINTPMSNELIAILERITNGQFTETDIVPLRNVLETGDRQSFLQLGKYGVNIEQGHDIHIGDRIYNQWDEQAIQSLVKAIQQATPKTILSQFQSLIADKTDGFVGREYVFDAIEAFISNNPKGYFTIIGDPGQGKSAILAKYVLDRGCIAHFNQLLQGPNRADQFLESVCRQLIERYRLPYNPLPSNAKQDGEFLVQLLDEITQQRKGEKVIIAVDALDEVDTNSYRDAANILYLPAYLPNGVYFILTRRRGVEVPLTVSTPYQLLNLLDYQINIKRDVRTYIQNRINSSKQLRLRIKEQYKLIMDFTSETEEQNKLITDFISETEEQNKLITDFTSETEEQNKLITDFINKISEKSKDNFMYLRYVLQDIESGLYQDLTLEQFPQGLQGYYNFLWRQMGMTDDPLPVEKIKIVYILGEVREPVSLRKICDFSGEEQYTVQKVLNEWKQFLHEFNQENEKRYSVYHSSFRDFLHRQDILEKHPVTIPGIHQLIAKNELKVWQKLKGALKNPRGE